MRTAFLAFALMFGLSAQASDTQLLLVCDGYMSGTAFQVQLVKVNSATYLRDLFEEDLLMKRVSLTSYESEDGSVTLSKVAQDELTFVLSVDGTYRRMNCVLP